MEREPASALSLWCTPRIATAPASERRDHDNDDPDPPKSWNRMKLPRPLRTRHALIQSLDPVITAECFIVGLGTTLIGVVPTIEQSHTTQPR